MDGGGGDAPYKIKSAEGLGFMNQAAETAEYPFICGQKTLSRTPSPRLITVSFDSAGAGENSQEALAAAAHDEGRLYISSGGKDIYADCYVSALSKTAVYGKNYERYVIQFTCDYPYFKGKEAKTAALFERTRLLKGSFTLPKLFSKRTVGSYVQVVGDKEVYPVITVGGISREEGFDLVFTNETTGAVLKAALPGGEYRSIVFDLANGTVTCGGEDFTVYLDDESFMSDFYLQRGENRISVTAGGIDVNTSAAVSYEEEYISAAEV